MDDTLRFKQQDPALVPSLDQGPEQRKDSRFTVPQPAEYSVKMLLGRAEFYGECMDYSPFGLGLRLKLTADLPLISIGEAVELECDFVGSRFRARGVVANTRVERIAEGDFVRLGLLLSRSAEVVRPAHMRRRQSRIHMNESLSPLVALNDELRFGDVIFAKMIDVSQGGMRLLVDRQPLPLLEKQRHWFDIQLPVYGLCRIFCRIAYVLHEKDSLRYLVGCEFIDGGGEDNLSILEDWLFYANCWLSLNDIRAAGFSASHLNKNDENFRMLLSPMAKNDNGREEVEFSGRLSSECVRIVASCDLTEGVLFLKSMDALVSDREAMLSAWKSILIFCFNNGLSNVEISEECANSPLVSNALATTQPRRGKYRLVVEQLLHEPVFRWWLWRGLIRDFRRKKNFNLPRVSSLFHRMLLM
jgi:hypothetical protein